MQNYINRVDVNQAKELLEKVVKSITFISNINDNDNLSVYTNKDVCNILGINEKQLRKYRYNGLFAYSRVGDKYWYTQSDINEFMARNHRNAFGYKTTYN